MTESAGTPASKQPGWMEPRPTSSGTSPLLPETAGYRWKRRLLGPPLISENASEQHLSKPIALAVLSSDVMSSSAYGTESVLRILVPAAGLGAFGLITPITVMLLVVLGIVCLCYRNVVQTYPVSGGSYVVSRENFGFTVAQIPGAALLCSYTLTVAVSIAAGVDAIFSAFPGLQFPHDHVISSVFFVALLTFGNLRGIKEAGRVFAIPTYWFLASMFVLLVVGVVKLVLDGGLGHIHPTQGALPAHPAGGGLLLGASVFIFLRGFANGGSAMTGMEAISNAVTVFREPQVRNARQTMVAMAGILGMLFLGVSVFAALTHALPFASGTPTVLSQIGDHVFGPGAGRVAYYSLQFSTALILVLGANTSFNGFPLLVSFIAQDSYLPRPFTTRGHRLVYSNGILVLAGLSVALLVVTNADVAALIPLYACTVFTGFTMAGAGMTRYHMTHPGPKQKKGLLINGFAFVCSFGVTMIFVITEFTRGAWAVVVVIPLIVFALSRTHGRYETERTVLSEEAAPAAVASRTLKRGVVILLVDRIDLATARALQLARSLSVGDELRAVHFDIDDERAKKLQDGWTRLGLDKVSLEVVECPDRRLVRAVTELADDLASDGETEVLMVLPRRAYKGFWGRVLHDHTADRIVASVTQIPNASATIAPFDIERTLRRASAARAEDEAVAEIRSKRGVQSGGAVKAAQGAVGADAEGAGEVGDGSATRVGSHRRRSSDGAGSRHGVEAVGAGEDWHGVRPPGAVPIGEVRHRQRVKIAGRIRSVRVTPWSGVPTFECTLVDGTGAMTVVFLGRRSVSGLEPGVKLIAEGTIGNYQGRLAMLNPTYDFLASATSQTG